MNTFNIVLSERDMVANLQNLMTLEDAGSYKIITMNMGLKVVFNGDKRKVMREIYEWLSRRKDTFL
jgi:hypothetical protein